MGKIVGVWGVKGWVKLHSYTRNRADIANYPRWWLQSKNGAPTLYEVLECREQGRGIVANLRGIDDRDQAMLLNGQQIFVEQSDLPELPDGEYYWQQLIGLQVSNREGLLIGEITSIMETGAHDVLVVERSNSSGDNTTNEDLNKSSQEVLIPYNEQTVVEVDLAANSMLVDWDPAFLLDS